MDVLDYDYLDENDELCDLALETSRRNPGKCLLKCCEQDLSRKGTKRSKSQIMVVFPSHLSIEKGFEGKLGHLEDLNTSEPKLVIEAPEGRLLFRGRLIHSSNALFTVDCMPNGSSSTISDLYQDILVFGEPSYEATRVSSSASSSSSSPMSSTRSGGAPSGTISDATDENIGNGNPSTSFSFTTPSIPDKGTSLASQQSTTGKDRTSPQSSEKTKKRIVDFGISTLCDPTGAAQISSGSKPRTSSQASNSQRDPIMSSSSSSQRQDEEGLDSDGDDDHRMEDGDEVEYLDLSDTSVGGERRSSRSVKKRNYAEYAQDEDGSGAVGNFSEGEEGEEERDDESNLSVLSVDDTEKVKRANPPKATSSRAKPARQPTKKKQAPPIEILDTSSSSGTDDNHDYGSSEGDGGSDEDENNRVKEKGAGSWDEDDSDENFAPAAIKKKAPNKALTGNKSKAGSIGSTTRKAPPKVANKAGRAEKKTESSTVRGQKPKNTATTTKKAKKAKKKRKSYDSDESSDGKSDSSCSEENFVTKSAVRAASATRRTSGQHSHKRAATSAPPKSYSELSEDEDEDEDDDDDEDDDEDDEEDYLDDDEE